MQLLSILLLPLILIPSVTGGSSPQPSVLWAKTWGGVGEDYATGIVRDTTGNLYVLGESYSFSLSYTAVLLKYDPSGLLIWQKLLRPGLESAGKDLALDQAGDVYVLGDTVSSLNSVYSWNVFVAKISPTGVLMWNTTWGGPDYDYGQGIAIDSVGSIYVAGSTRSFGAGSWDAFLLKFNSTGVLLWQRTWGGGGLDKTTGIALDSSGRTYLTGVTYSFGYSSGGLFLIAVDDSGNLLWQRIWLGMGGAAGFGLTLDVRGEIYVAGTTVSGGGSSYAVGLDYNSSGYLLWQRTWGDGKGDKANGISLDSDGNLLIVGDSNDTGFVKAVLLVIDPKGILQSSSLWGGEGTNSASRAVSAETGDVLVTGYVSESPPYTSTEGNATLVTQLFQSYTSGNLTLATPSFQTSPLNMNITDISGSESYAGREDFFLLKYQLSTGSSGISSTILFYSAVLVIPLIRLLTRRVPSASTVHEWFKAKLT